MAPNIALATCAAFPELAEDDPLLRDELQRRGLAVLPVVWDDADVEWDAHDLVIVRSTWDYAARHERYIRWAKSVRRLLNAAEIIEWNTDKRYLAEVPHAVATAFLEPGDTFEPPAGQYVLKPSISQGSRDTARYGPGDEQRATAHAERLLEDGRAVMVQPYLKAVDDHGETALIYFDGS